MSDYSRGYHFLSDDEALSFIGLMTGELRRLAHDRDFRLVMPSLRHTERTIEAMQRVLEK